MRLSLLFSIALICYSISVYSQTTEQTATLIQRVEFVKEVPSIAAQLEAGIFIPAQNITREFNPKKRDSNKAVPGKGLPQGNDPLWQNQIMVNKIKGKEPILTFEAASANATPTDPTGAVGPNHFINAWNSAFRIWDKEGNPLTPPASLGTILNGNMGDPIVFYDQFADRFVITEFYSNGFGMAVCQGPDPVNDGWYEYLFNTNSFPDYPKFSLWSDGYYITANKNSGSAGTTEVVYVADRSKMLNGDPSAQMIGFPLPDINTNGFFSPLGFNVNGNTAPPPGDAPIVYMQDDSWSGVSTDHLKIWNINVDWDNPENSTISDPQVINTSPFDGLFDGGSFSNLEQPSGPDIDALQATIMYMAQYRRLPNYNTVVFNFVVDLDGNDALAGIRWYELRQPNDGDPWEIYQEGTYVQPDGHSAFSGNMCMDANGNIALAYTIVSPTMYPSLRFTGRFSNDPLNVMTIEEESFANGTINDPSFRYGDYSQMTIDPVNDDTFWTIGEYFNGGPRKNQVGVFKIAPTLAVDVGIASVDSPANGVLGDSEPITVSIRNFGLEGQSNIPVSYQIDDGPVISEVYSDVIPSLTEVQYTFTVPGDFSEVNNTYKLFSETNLSTDQNNINDSLTANVKHLFSKDIGVTEILSPQSGVELTTSETVKVVVKNFGAETLSDFDISYILNGEAPVNEQVAGPLESETELIYTFNETADFSAVMNHVLSISTSLAEDADPLNDTISAIVSNTLCQPELICELGIGIFALELAEINNTSGCDPNGYGNYTNYYASLEQGSVNNLTISCEYGSVYVKVWIDFNDDFVLSADEIVVNDYVIADGQQAGNYTETMNLTIPTNANIGEHLMRVKTNYNESVPEDPCGETLFGETEDYIAIIDNGTGLSYQSIESNELIVREAGNNQFMVSFKASQINETLTLSVYNMQGQSVIYNRVKNQNGSYEFDFDMSYAPKGVYLVRLGSDSFGKIKRIVVR